jgi:DNA-binding winged helix-turn-helix (wHTH) protein
VEVLLVRWPVEEERRRRLAERGVARLLLVEDDAAPPELMDCLEDWIRLPASDGDRAARVEGLRRRHRLLAPQLDEDGVLRFGGGWVSMSPLEARLVDVLLDHLGAVVERDVLRQSVWPATSPVANALDVHITRLRRRLAPLGLVIRTVRGRGFVLEFADCVGDVATITPSTSANLDARPSVSVGR